MSNEVKCLCRQATVGLFQVLYVNVLGKIGGGHPSRDMKSRVLQCEAMLMDTPGTVTTSKSDAVVGDVMT
jgi:hypothetical protein